MVYIEKCSHPEALIKTIRLFANDNKKNLSQPFKTDFISILYKVG